MIRYSSWEDHGQGADMGALGTCHKALRPLGIDTRADQAGHERHGTVTPNSGPSGGSRQQVMTGNAIKNGCEMLINAMSKPDGTFRTYDEMKAENIPLRYDGQLDGLHVHACDLETARESPFPSTCTECSWPR